MARFGEKETKESEFRDKCTGSPGYVLLTRIYKNFLSPRRGRISGHPLQGNSRSNVTIALQRGQVLGQHLFTETSRQRQCLCQQRQKHWIRAWTIWREKERDGLWGLWGTQKSFP